MCWFKSNSKKELGIFFSSRRQAEPGAERAPSPFLIYAKRRPRLWLASFFSPSVQSKSPDTPSRPGLFVLCGKLRAPAARAETVNTPCPSR